MLRWNTFAISVAGFMTKMNPAWNGKIFLMISSASSVAPAKMISRRKSNPLRCFVETDKKEGNWAIRSLLSTRMVCCYVLSRAFLSKLLDIFLTKTKALCQIGKRIEKGRQDSLSTVCLQERTRKRSMGERTLAVSITPARPKKQKSDSLDR